MTHHNAHSSGSGKDVIYIDVDDEITAVIDKVLNSKQRIIALVLPKRATAFQSVVNMKLLKRSSDQAKKSIVLITSEASLLPLAGSVGLHVAKSLQSKPEVPDEPEKVDDKAEAVEEEAFAAGAAAVRANTAEPKLDKTKSLAELNGDEDDEETIELDDVEEDPLKDDEGKTDKGSLKSKLKKFKIPDFNKFRLALFGGGAALVLLIFLGVMAFVVMPKAQITISTDSSAIEISQDLKLKTGENVTLDVAQSILPATRQESKKTLTQEVPATGQRNEGAKASGSVTLSLNDCSKDQVTVPAGTGVSANGKTFITKTSATLESVEVGNQCKNSQFPQFSTKTVAVTAQTGGAANNIGPSSFTVSGHSNVTGQSSAAMAGGTDVIIKVVAQADIDSAKQKIGTTDNEAIKLELTQALQDAGLFPVESSFNTAAPTTKQSANVGDTAEVVSVTQDLVYSMFGIKREDLEKIVAEKANAEIDPSKQSILNYGFDEAVFTALTTQGDTTTVGFQTTVITGSDLDAEAIKKQVAGKKANDAKELISENPGVTDVQVKYSPFWVSSIPKKTGKITVIIEKPKVTNDDAESQSNE